MAAHVCFLVSEHPFLDARIFKKEARCLQKHGFHVTMIVPRKNGYLFDVDGSFFYQEFLSQSFVHKGITIITYEQTKLENQLKTLDYNLHAMKPVRFTDPLTQLGIAQHADIYHAHEFSSLYSGVGIKQALASQGKKCKLIFDSHEFELDPLVKQSQTTKQLKQQIMNTMFKDTDFLITVSESIKSRYHTLFPNIPIAIIYNSPPLATNYAPGQGKNLGLLMAFEGAFHAQNNHFHKLLQIVKQCNEHFPFQLSIIGGKKNTDHQITLSIPSAIKHKVHLKGWVDYDLLSKAMDQVDVGWIDLDAKTSWNNRYAMPNKFFSYLNNGIPVIVNDCDDMHHFIQTYHCGYVIKKRQAKAEDYVQALRLLKSNPKQLVEMSINARKVMEERFCWEHMETRLLDIYNQLIGK